MIFEKYNEAKIITDSLTFARSTCRGHSFAVRIHRWCMWNASAVSYDMTTRVTISLALPVCNAGPRWFEIGPEPPCLGARLLVPWAIWNGSGREPVSRPWCTRHNSSAPRIPRTSGYPRWPAWSSRIPHWRGSSTACRPEVHFPACTLSPRCCAQLPVPKSARWSHQERPISALGCPWARR